MLMPDDAVRFVIDALNELGAHYFITGSIASNAYGESRSTIDADFVVDMDAPTFLTLRSRLLTKFSAEAQMAFETVTGKTQHKFRDEPTGFLIEIFEAKMDDPHEAARFARISRKPFLDRMAFFPSPEDVVIQKLRWFAQIRRSKDSDDVVKVLYHQWPTLDWKYIEHWCVVHASLTALETCRAAASRIRVEDGLTT